MSIKRFLFTILCLTVAACTFSSCHHRGLTGNPYIDAKEKPSQKQAKEDKKIVSRGNKAYKKQIDENQDNIADNNKKFFRMRKHYKHKKVKKERKTRS